MGGGSPPAASMECYDLDKLAGTRLEGYVNICFSSPKSLPYLVIRALQAPTPSPPHLAWSAGGS